MKIKCRQRKRSRRSAVLPPSGRVAVVVRSMVMRPIKAAVYNPKHLSEGSNG